MSIAMKFPIGSLPLELLKSVLKSIPYDEALRSLKVCKWLRVFYRRFGPFLYKIKVVHTKSNANQEDPKQIEILIQQGDRKQIQLFPSKDDHPLFQMIHSCANLWIEHHISELNPSGQAKLENFLSFLPKPRYLSSLLFYGLHPIEGALERLHPHLIQSPKTIGYHAISPDHLNERITSHLYQFLQRFGAQSQRLQFNFFSHDWLRRFAELKNLTYFVSRSTSSAGFKGLIEPMIEWSNQNHSKTIVITLFSGLISDSIEELFCDLTEEWSSIPDWIEMDVKGKAVPKTRDQCVTAFLRERIRVIEQKAITIGIRAFGRTYPLNHGFITQKLEFGYVISLPSPHIYFKINGCL